jgi:hypothetical protein
MKKAQSSKPTPFVSRRSGFDRRWIPSQNHQPERRRGKDRRKIRSRSFLESLDTETMKTDDSAGSDADSEMQEARSSHSTKVEKWTPGFLEIMLKSDSPVDE